MITLVSGATRFPRSEPVGHLIVPGAGNAARSLRLQPWRWAMDNGAFSGFDPVAFERMLHKFQREAGCLFVTCPDVVGDAEATFALWPKWSRVILAYGFRPAWVAQDGLEPEWTPRCDAVFIGGTTAFKESRFVHNLCAYAKARGRWVHWGRVNTRRRYNMAVRSGADSIDGTGFSMFPNAMIPKLAEWAAQLHAQPELL